MQEQPAAPPPVTAGGFQGLTSSWGARGWESRGQVGAQGRPVGWQEEGGPSREPLRVGFLREGGSGEVQGHASTWGLGIGWRYLQAMDVPGAHGEVNPEPRPLPPPTPRGFSCACGEGGGYFRDFGVEHHWEVPLLLEKHSRGVRGMSFEALRLLEGGIQQVYGPWGLVPDGRE